MPSFHGAGSAKLPDKGLLSCPKQAGAHQEQSVQPSRVQRRQLTLPSGAYGLKPSMYQPLGHACVRTQGEAVERGNREAGRRAG